AAYRRQWRRCDRRAGAHDRPGMRAHPPGTSAAQCREPDRAVKARRLRESVMTEDSINRAGLPGRLIKPSKELYSDVIYDQIIAQICNGVFPIGTRLPSEQQFARMFE